VLAARIVVKLPCFGCDLQGNRDRVPAQWQPILHTPVGVSEELDMVDPYDGHAAALFLFAQRSGFLR
jgi:hypothetical protein